MSRKTKPKDVFTELLKIVAREDIIAVPDTTSREDKLQRRKALRCSFCAPHKGENASSSRKKRGTKKPTKPRGKR